MRQLPRAVTMFSLVAVLLVLGGCGSSSSSTSSVSTSSSAATSSAAATSSSASSSSSVGHLPTVKFALHAGLAFGAFHRYIYKPVKSGAFSGGILHHKLAAVKAGLAGLFAYHELKLALEDAKASPTLSKLTAPVAALADKLKGVASSAKSGSPDLSSIDSASGDITSLKSLAQGAGISIPDQTPSAGQLASGGSS